MGGLDLDFISSGRMPINFYSIKIFKDKNAPILRMYAKLDNKNEYADIIKWYPEIMCIFTIWLTIANVYIISEYHFICVGSAFWSQIIHSIF